MALLAGFATGEIAKIAGTSPDRLNSTGKSGGLVNSKSFCLRPSFAPPSSRARGAHVNIFLHDRQESRL